MLELSRYSAVSWPWVETSWLLPVGGLCNKQPYRTPTVSSYVTLAWTLSSVSSLSLKDSEQMHGLLSVCVQLSWLATALNCEWNTAQNVDPSNFGGFTFPLFCISSLFTLSWLPLRIIMTLWVVTQQKSSVQTVLHFNFQNSEWLWCLSH
jgi:hypothetical protein